jgi:hypothetical protein
MLKFWSETSGALIRELVADGATAAWVFFWTTVAGRLYLLFAGFADAGRALRDGGQGLQSAGVDLGE